MEVALNALRGRWVRPHHFLGVNQQGQSAVIRTKRQQNTAMSSCAAATRALELSTSVNVAQVDSELERKRHLASSRAIVVDCSHANSKKDHKLAARWSWRDVVSPGGREAARAIVGVMVESNLHGGKERASPRTWAS